MTYEVLSRFYDATQGDRAEHARYLRGLLERHHPAARTVLELACGTGSILKQLQPRYEVTGVDLSAEMLAVAAAKLPGTRLIQADMTQVGLDERFDVVLCVYDSINHLLAFEQWQAVFDRAREHLDDRGVFIFDINTERRLANLIDQQPMTHWFGDSDLLILDVRAGDDGVSVWDLRIFEHLGKASYRLHREDIPEASFPAERIAASLRERFTRVRAYDATRSRPTVRSDRLHFVCTA